MKKYCFHPPKNIIVGTLAAMLWVAVSSAGCGTRGSGWGSW